jgi:hypothetical protein
MRRSHQEDGVRFIAGMKVWKGSFPLKRRRADQRAAFGTAGAVGGAWQLAAQGSERVDGGVKEVRGVQGELDGCAVGSPPGSF